MIIRTDQSIFIKVDGSIRMAGSDLFSCYGWRWNRNAGKFGDFCIGHNFYDYDEVTEADLPKALPRLEIDE